MRNELRRLRHCLLRVIFVVFSTSSLLRQKILSENMQDKLRCLHCYLLRIIFCYTFKKLFNSLSRQKILSENMQDKLHCLRHCLLRVIFVVFSTNSLSRQRILSENMRNKLRRLRHYLLRVVFRCTFKKLSSSLLRQKILSENMRANCVIYVAIYCVSFFVVLSRNYLIHCQDKRS